VSQAHFSAIESAHPDLDSINASPDFDRWINSRPVHLQAAYAYTRDHGSPAEVISMLNEYKGVAAPKVKPTAVIPAARVAAASAVSRRRGAPSVSAEAEQTDLEAIWNETAD
jgi:hypothetical protein